MRIISGSHKGHVIRPPRGLPIRPTTDRSKESLFNILNNRFDFEESDALDLFSGGGSVSLEFCSRGVRSLVSVDRFPGCVNYVKSESTNLGFDMITVVKADVMQYIRNTTDTFDIIFCDAPYSWTEYEIMIRIILDRGLLNKGGELIVEHHSVKNFDTFPEIIDKRAYGQNVLSFFGTP